MSKLAIIPARGGSKRIPKKNIKLFLGKPIIAYSIEAAIKSGLFSEVMVSTDDAEIAQIAESYGARVPFLRSEKNSDDFSTTAAVIQEVIEKYKDQGKEFDSVCCLYPCAPFVNEHKLIVGHELIHASGFDSAFTVTKFSFPIQRALRIDNNQLSFHQPEYAARRSQDLEEFYHDCGQFYWIKTKIFSEEKTLVSKNSGAIIISELEAQDIDNETDWKLAEMKFKLLQNDSISN